MIGKCKNCGRFAQLQVHHIIHRSQAPALKKFKPNLIKICPDCHGKIHGKDGRNLDIKLKHKYLLNVTNLLKKEYYTEDELKDLLDMPSNDVRRLCKTLKSIEGLIYQEDLIIALMGGKINLMITEV